MDLGELEQELSEDAAALFAQLDPLEARSARRIFALYARQAARAGEPLESFLPTQQGGCFLTARRLIHIWRPLFEWRQDVLLRSSLEPGTASRSHEPGVVCLHLKGRSEDGEARELTLPFLEEAQAETLLGQLGVPLS